MQAKVKFPNPRAQKIVKCPGSARGGGGILKFRFDRRIILALKGNVSLEIKTTILSPPSLRAIFILDSASLQSYNTIVRLLVSPPRGFSGLIYNTLWGTLARLFVTQFTIFFFMEVKDAPVQIRLDHNSGDYVPYSYRTASGFFNVPYYLISNKGYETGPPVYSPYPRRLESQTICRCNYKGSTFSSVILRP